MTAGDNKEESMDPHSDTHCGDASEATLCERFEQALRAEAAGAASLVRRGRTFSADWIVRIGSTPFLLRTQEGRLREVRRGLPLLCPSALSISASPVAWAALWDAVPRAGWHDIFALSKRGEMRFEGNMQLFLAHLQYVKDVLSLPRMGGRA